MSPPVRYAPQGAHPLQKQAQKQQQRQNRGSAVQLQVNSNAQLNSVDFCSGSGVHFS